MKTWEMMKMLTENPELKFQYKSESGFYNTVCADNGWLKGEYSYINCNFNTEWEIIQEPVDFTTAIKTYQNGKTIKCEREKFRNNRYNIVFGEGNVIADNNGYGISAEEILNGKWYIED